MSYRATIARQPQQLNESLQAICAKLKVINLNPLTKLSSQGSFVIVGIGASYEAGVVTAHALQREGIRSAPWHASHLIAAKNPGQAIIALSSGGRSVEPIEALRQHVDLFSIAITSEGNTPLDAQANLSLNFHCGEDATPSSVGYTSMLLATGLLVDTLSGKSVLENWQDVGQLADEILTQSALTMAQISKLFATRRAIDCIGAGPALGTAGEAALLIREAARIPASSADTLYYLHGPMEAMDKTTGVVIFGDNREVKLAQDLAKIGCAVLLITTNKQAKPQRNLEIIHMPACVNPIKRAILDILPAQLLAAQLSDDAGLTDTKFRYRQTDTKIKD